MDDTTTNARISDSLVSTCRCSADLHPHNVNGRTVWRREHDDTCTSTNPAGVGAIIIDGSNTPAAILNPLGCSSAVFGRSA